MFTILKMCPPPAPASYGWSCLKGTNFWRIASVLKYVS